MKNDAMQSMQTYLFVGGRLHGEEKLVPLDGDQQPQPSYTDLVSGITYYPRVVGYAPVDQVTGLPTASWEATFYFMEGINDQNQAMMLMADILLGQYMRSHGTKVKVEAKAQLAPGQRPSGLVLPN
jgi:hypothetical protein